MPKKTNIPLPSFHQAAPQKPTPEQIEAQRNAENLARYQQLVGSIFLNLLHNPDFFKIYKSIDEGYEDAKRIARKMMLELYGAVIKDKEDSE